MSISKGLIGELDFETVSTRKILERIPVEKFDWKPHEKSTSMGELATHVADMFNWYPATLEADEMDFASGYEMPKPATTEELVALLDKNVAAAKASLEKSGDEIYMRNWTLRNGEHVLFTMPKLAVVRTFVMNHIVHHRGQLSIYLRLNDIAVPAMYGPSADEQM